MNKFLSDTINSNYLFLNKFLTNNTTIDNSELIINIHFNEVNTLVMDARVFSSFGKEEMRITIPQFSIISAIIANKGMIENRVFLLILKIKNDKNTP